MERFAFAKLIILGAKGYFRSLRRIALFALIPPLLIAAAFFAAGPVFAGALSPGKLSLVFCDLEGSAYFDTLSGLMLSDEAIDKTATVQKLGYQEALRALEGGLADAVIVFPETFLRDMIAGVNQPVRVLIGDVEPLRAALIREFMQSAAAEISAAQSAINTVWYHMDTQSMSQARMEGAFSALVFEYASKAFSRSLLYTFRNVPPSYEGGSPAAFFLTSYLAAFLLFGCASGVKRLIAERALGVPARLAATGFSAARVALYHFIPLFLTLLFSACCAALTVAAAFWGLGLQTDAAGGATGAAAGAGISASGAVLGDAAGRMVLCFLVLAVLCGFTASFALFLGQLLRRAASAEIFVATSGALMAVVGGTLIPYPYLPEYFQTLGFFSFNRWAQKLVAAALFSAPDARGGGAAALLSALYAKTPDGTLPLIPLAAFLALAALLFAASAGLVRRNLKNR
ncbi:MAG: ABC transporter permease [Clostridiales bacterium]|jgi:hypothetical protein|nr:ABC transporter permease [Clostridiales bacterium]